MGHPDALPGGTPPHGGVGQDGGESWTRVAADAPRPIERRIDAAHEHLIVPDAQDVDLTRSWAARVAHAPDQGRRFGRGEGFDARLLPDSQLVALRYDATAS